MPPDRRPVSPAVVVQLVGSPTGDAWRELSELYARASLEALADPARYRFPILHASPDGVWRAPTGLDPAALAAADPLTLSEAVAWLTGCGAALALPQMFCPRGMTDVRALLDLIGLPYLGNRPLTTAIAADKALAKALVAAAGVDVPAAVALRAGDPLPAVASPVVVKPVDADNSAGASFVDRSAALSAALEAAWAHAAVALVEAYVPLGREVRCGVLERGGELICLPLEEYFVDARERPIRRAGDKLKRGADGTLTLGAKTRAESWIVAGDDPVVPAVHAAARRCYRALGSRQYNLFDFRVDPDGRPWFLESGPYCSFAPQSVIATMAEAAGTPLRRLFAESFDEALRA